MKNGYIQCIHARTNVLGACDWGVDYEGNVVGGCEVETPKPTHEIIAFPAPTHANTAPKPECCRAAVFTPELKSMYDNLCRKKVLRPVLPQQPGYDAGSVSVGNRH